MTDIFQREMHISGPTLFFGQWLSTISYIYAGADKIASCYASCAKRPFALPAISNYQVLVSSPEHFKELAQAPDEMLSFYKAMNERLFFKHTMGGFVPDNGVDEKNAIPNRVFKTLARENLTRLDRPLTEGVKDVFARFFEQGKVGEQGFSRIKLQELSGTLIARMNNTLLFGEELGKSLVAFSCVEIRLTRNIAKSPGFEQASIKYGWHSGIAMEIFRQIPKWSVP
jgi:hypothetical protein